MTFAALSSRARRSMARPRRRSHQRLGTALDKSDQYSTGTTSTATQHWARTLWRSSKGEQIFQTGLSNRSYLIEPRKAEK